MTDTTQFGRIDGVLQSAAGDFDKPKPELYPAMAKLVAKVTEAQEADEAKKLAVALNKEILDGLQTIRKFGDSLQAAITKELTKDLTTKDATSTRPPDQDANAAVADTIKTALSAVLGGRRTALDHYETAVLFIGQTAGLPVGE